MIQGVGSNVGKSVIVAGLCRALTRRGYRVRPFKPQNMSNNAAAVADGQEIGRAQHLQARACRVPAEVDMNPVLLKPETETGSQVVVHGRYLTTVQPCEYAELKPALRKDVLASFYRLAANCDMIIVEGAGSPAETNLRKNDIANMGFAREVRVPVLLVGDIERGGVIAQLVGTQTVLESNDAKMIQGFLVNRFRGDINLFADGIKDIVQRTGWTSYGTIPWFDSMHWLPAEDAQDLSRKPGRLGDGRITCLVLSRIANFDDLDPLRMEPNLHVELLESGCPLPVETDIVIIPGSKSTRGDLEFIRSNGWDIDILAHWRRGGRVLGICGGYQMLGRMIRDPEGIEGNAGDSHGLGLLNVETIMQREKQVREVTATLAAGASTFPAYEIHMGNTEGEDTARPFAWIKTKDSLRPDGAISADGRVEGTYLHGLFSDNQFRQTWLKRQCMSTSDINYGQEIDGVLDLLAEHMETYVDIDGIIAMMRRIE